MTGRFALRGLELSGTLCVMGDRDERGENGSEKQNLEREK